MVDTIEAETRRAACQTEEDLVRWVQQGEAASTALFQKLGFRRVGRSDYVCYASLDSSHPSHFLPAAEDPPSFCIEPYTESQRQMYPVHTTMRSKVSEDEIVEILNGLPCTFDFTSAQNGATLVHIAAAYARFKLLVVLVEEKGAQSCLYARNALGDTPLESLQHRMETEKLRSIANCSWEGHHHESFYKCERYLMEKMGLNADEEIDEETFQAYLDQFL